MPDIQLRFNRDMLVLSAPLDAALARQGIDAARDRQYLNLMEPDVLEDALRLEQLAGAQCLVTTTEDITRARLAHARMENDAARLAHAAVQLASGLKPQHILAEIGPCGLPLDPSSKTSLNENRAQYAEAARLFSDEPVDALFLNGFTSLDDLKCALMGVRQVYDGPVFASVSLEGSAPIEAPRVAAAGQTPDEHVLENISPTAAFSGYQMAEVPQATGVPAARAGLPERLWPEAVNIMVDLGVSVVGFETAEPAAKAEGFAREAARITSLPLLAQLRVTRDSQAKKPSPLVPLEDILEYTPDTMAPSAVKLYAAGVQFLRATGYATASFTGGLAATVFGLDVLAR